jgi:23S rRNA (cytosine1962-C5)-methyltransferase
VLNTFAYTCGFGVVARLGGATRAVNVDLSRRVLDWGEQNLRHNGLTPDRHDFVAGDTFEWLARFARKGEAFDLVVLDPPGFSGAGKRRFSAQRDYHLLVEAAEPLLAPGGLLLAMCNVEAMTAHDLEEQVRRGLGTRRAALTSSFGASAVDFHQPAALKCQAWKA